MNSTTRELLEEILQEYTKITAIALDGELENIDTYAVFFVEADEYLNECYLVVTNCLERKFTDGSVDSMTCCVVVRNKSEFSLPKFAKNCVLVYKEGEWFESGLPMSVEY